MNIDEAYKVLNVNKNTAMEEIKKKFEYIFKANERPSGTSLYLQSKILRAYESILEEREPTQEQNKAK